MHLCRSQKTRGQLRWSGSAGGHKGIPNRATGLDTPIGLQLTSASHQKPNRDNR